MADVITRLKVESSEYDSKIQRAVKGIQQLESSTRNAGKSMKDISGDELAFVQNLGKMDTVAANTKGQLNELSAAILSLQQQYKSLSDEEKASPFGQAMAVSIDQMKQRAAVAQDTISDLSAEIKHMASDTPVFDKLAGGVGLVTDSFAVLQGSAQALGIKNQDILDSMAKLQGAMAVSNALVRIQNALQKQSAVMIGITTVQKKAETLAIKLNTAAQGKNIAATTAATAAQKVLNAVAKANPYVLLASAVLGVAAALYGLSRAAGSSSSSTSQAEKDTKKLREAYKTVGESVGDVLGKYKVLQKEWVNLSSETKKKTWIEQNSEAFKQLGLNISTVVNADRAFVTESQNVIDALKKRASAAAIKDIYQEQVKKAYEEVSEASSKYINQYKKGDQVRERALIKAGLVEGEDYKKNTLKSGKSWTSLTEKGAEKFNTFWYEKIFDTLLKGRIEKIDKIYGGLLEDAVQKTQEAISKTNGLVEEGDKVITNQGKASDKVKDALEDYANTIAKAKLRKEAGLDDETEYTKKELSAHERLYEAYADAYNTYADPKYKEAMDKEAAEILRLSAAVKSLTDATKEAENKARQIKQTDTSILRGLTSKAKSAAWDSSDLGVTGFKAKIDAGIDISDDEWRAVEDRLNARLQAMGLEPIKINFETGNIEEVFDKVKKEHELLMNRFSSGVGAVSSLVGSLDNLKSIGEDLASAFSGDMDTWDALMTVFNSGISIMQTVMGVMEAINTLQELSSTLSKKKVADQAAETTAVVTGKSTEAAANLQEAGTSMTAAGANAAESSSAAGKAVAGIPIVGPILAVAAIAAVLAATFAAMSKAKSAGSFATGGIIPGNSFSGDNQIASVNAGELILSRSQQANIAGQLNSNPMGNLALSMMLKGEDIQICLDNNRMRRGR